MADAGALPALPRDLAPQFVLTPHAGELAALLAAATAPTPAATAVEDATLAAARQAAG